MSDTATIVTRDEMRAKLLELCDANPDKRNPMNSAGGCLWVTMDGTDRCLISQMAHDFGWQTPDYDVLVLATGAAIDAEWPIDLDDAKWLSQIQIYADNRAGGDVPPRTWAEVVECIKDPN